MKNISANDFDAQNTIEYRQKFREHVIPWWYSGILHLLLNSVSTIGTCIYISTWISNLTWQESLAFPVTLLIGNLGVYLIHKFPLHRPYPFIHTQTFAIHTDAHHQFYTDEHVVYDKRDDWFILFFPPLVVLSLVFIYLPIIHFLLPMILPLNAVYMVMIGSVLYFILYEVFHYISHLPEDHYLLRIRVLNFIRQHHVYHHNPKLMYSHNFNIVFPLCDYLFGTVYKPPLAESEETTN